MPPVFHVTSSRKIIIDCGRVITAYPLLAWQGGAGVTITVTAAEVPTDTDKRKLLPRDNPLAGILPGLMMLFTAALGPMQFEAGSLEWDSSHALSGRRY